MRITTKENDIASILYSEKQIAAMVETLGEKITEDYQGTRPVMVCVLKGASLFFTDLCREIDLNIDMDFISVSSYGASSKSSGVVRLVKDLDTDRTYITSQNHGYAVVGESVDPSIARVRYVNLNDGSVEGIEHIGRPVFTVQFHPEVCPGPMDTSFLFDRFLSNIDQAKGDAAKCL